MGKGLGVKQLYLQFVKLYCMNHNNNQSSTSTSITETRLVFCLNVNMHMIEGIQSELLSQGIPLSKLPKVIDNKIPFNTRKQLYNNGGCYFITSRILIVDYLTDKNIAKDTCGFLIYNAHKIDYMSTESFILKLFKESNSDGFIKVYDMNSCRRMNNNI
jgi:DNA excision repair protein ERCC-4